MFSRTSDNHRYYEKGNRKYSLYLGDSSDHEFDGSSSESRYNSPQDSGLGNGSRFVGDWDTAFGGKEEAQRLPQIGDAPASGAGLK